MEFRQIEAFVNVIKHKSFSKAADATFLSQPTISLHISSLEKELGIKLLERNNKQVLATAAGQHFYNYALNLINTRDEAKAAILDIKNNPQGIIELQSSTVPALVFLPKLMADFKISYPQIKFYLEQSSSVQVVDNIALNRGELGFVGQIDKQQALIFEPIFEDKDVLIAPSKGFLEHIDSDTISVKDFLHCPFIGRESGSATAKVLENELLKYGKTLKSLNIAARINSAEIIISSVGAGLGVSIISQKVAELNKHHHNLRIFNIEGLQKTRVFYLVHSKNAILSPAAAAFRQYILDLI